MTEPTLNPETPHVKTADELSRYLLVSLDGRIYLYPSPAEDYEEWGNESHRQGFVELVNGLIAKAESRARQEAVEEDRVDILRMAKDLKSTRITLIIKQGHTMTTPTVNKPASVIKTKEFSVSEMTGSASDNFGFSFENWKEHHPNVEIISVTPFQETYVENKFLVMYSEPEKDSSL